MRSSLGLWESRRRESVAAYRAPIDWNVAVMQVCVPYPRLYEHKIPQKLHHIWWDWHADGSFKQVIPPKPPGEAYWREWQKLHPHYEYSVWRASPSYAFVRAHFPHLLDAFLAYPRHIQRCDVFRCMLLSAVGGLYTDIDVMPYITMDKLLARYPHGRAFFATEYVASQSECDETKQQPIRQGEPELPVRVANYWMATVAGHPIFSDILAEMQRRSHLAVRCDYDVFFTTGPDVVSTVVHRQKKRYPDVVLLSTQESWVNFKHVITHSWREDADAIKQPLT